MKLRFLLKASILCWLTLWAGTAATKDTNLTGVFAHHSTAKRFITQMTTQHGFDKNYLNGLFSQAKNHKKTLVQINRPIKSTGVSKGSWNRYLKHRLNQTKINAGKRFIKKNRHTLQRAEKTYGVPGEYIVAILGIETNYGGFVGNTSTLSALSTLAFGKNRRRDYFAQELEDFLLLCRKEKNNPLKIKGSYAGAMGLGQFMPSSFKKYMVDFNGDGKKDMWNASDMIGSIGNYFKKNGWRKNTIFAMAATAKGNNFKTIDYGWRYSYSLPKLQKHGITPKKKFHAPKYYFIKLRSYKGYNLYIGGSNFFVVTRYNNSSKYAMATHLLAQKISPFL